MQNHGTKNRISFHQARSLADGALPIGLAHKVGLKRDIAHGQVVGWAGAGPYRSRSAYAGIAEHSVYVARAARGTGAGRAALDALCQVYATRGFRKIVSRIFPENTASLAVHERCGFRVLGVYRRHGQLEGVWRDCVVVEKLLDERA